MKNKKEIKRKLREQLQVGLSFLGESPTLYDILRYNSCKRIINELIKLIDDEIVFNRKVKKLKLTTKNKAILECEFWNFSLEELDLIDLEVRTSR